MVGTDESTILSQLIKSVSTHRGFQVLQMVNQELSFSTKNKMSYLLTQRPTHKTV